MEPSVLMENFNSLTLACYLAMASVTSEEKAHSHQQALKLLQCFEVVPKQDTLANCPECYSPLETTTDSNRYGWRYICKNHKGSRRRFSPLSNTILEAVRLNGGMSAEKLVVIINMWLEQVPLNKALSILSLSSDTGVFWYRFCRHVACVIAWHDFIQIGGARDVVEIGDTYLFKSKRKSGENKKVWVVGGISRSSKQVFAVIVENKDEDTLLPILQQCVDGESYVCTKYGTGYEKCDLIFSGHGIVNLAENFVNPPMKNNPIRTPRRKFNQECLNSKWQGKPPINDQQPLRIHLQTLASMWKGLKNFIKISFRFEHASLYVGEWMYRRNILGKKSSEREAFERFMRDMKRAYPGVGKKMMASGYEDIMDCECHECKM